MRKLALLLLPLILLLGFPLPVLAATLEQNEQILLEKDRVINEDYFATGETITLSGTVNGDAYVAGGNILVDGTINGDLLVAGGTVRIRGNVKNDVRAAGGNITVSGPVGGNITTMGGTVEISETATVSGSLVAGTGSLSIFGPIGKGATIGAGQTTIGNSVGGKVVAGVGQMTLAQGAKVNGDLEYWSEAEAQIAADASVSGTTTFHQADKKDLEGPEKAVGATVKGFGITFQILEAIAAFIIGALILRFAPAYTKRATDYTLDKPWENLAIGLIALIAIPIVLGILLITIVGIPLALILGALFLIEIYIAKVFSAILIGEKIMDWTKQDANKYLMLLVGIIVGAILGFIPIIGWLILLGVYLIAFGGLIMTKKNFYTEMRTKKVI